MKGNGGLKQRIVLAMFLMFCGLLVISLPVSDYFLSVTHMDHRLLILLGF